MDAALQKMDADKVKYEQKLECQAQLLDAKATKIRKLEGIHAFVHPLNHFSQVCGKCPYKIMIFRMSR